MRCGSDGDPVAKNKMQVIEAGLVFAQWTCALHPRKLAVKYNGGSKRGTKCGDKN